MVNRRHSVLIVVGVSTIIDLVCCVAKIITSVCLRMLCVCVAYLSVYECVCECVFLVVSELFLLITIIPI